MPGHLGAVSLKKKTQDIVILSFCNIVKGQAKYVYIVFLRQNHFSGMVGKSEE